MKLSKFGTKLTSRPAIRELMDRLGKAMNEDSEICMLGGGNPAPIPGIENLLRQRMKTILDDGRKYESMIGHYDKPQGNQDFLKALASLLNQTYGWNLKEKNICLTNGSQNTFFFLFNMFGGEYEKGLHKKILFPVLPEYIGYADQGIDEDLFVASKPEIDFIDPHTFKYKVNFDELKVDQSIGAICVSRPTNPTGNVLTKEEIEKLSDLAAKQQIPLIIDNAYGAPFPNIQYEAIDPSWNENIVLTFSFSKFGMPATRFGVVIAKEEIIEAVTSMNSIINLTAGSVGTSLLLDLVQTGDLLKVSKEVIQPFYRERAQYAQKLLKDLMPDHLPWYQHRCEGSMFIWLWLKDLPITDEELYQRLLDKKILVVPGHPFFFKQYPDWKHTQECLRINYSQNPEQVERGLKVLAQEIKDIY